METEDGVYLSTMTTLVVPEINRVGNVHGAYCAHDAILWWEFLKKTHFYSKNY